MKLSKCKSCGAKIKSLRTVHGNTVAVNDGDTIPVIPGGQKSVCVVTRTGEVVIGDPAWRGAPGAVEGYVNHLATCPDVEIWRKRAVKKRTREEVLD